MPTQGHLQLKNIVDEVFNPNFYFYCLFISHDLQQKIYQLNNSISVLQQGVEDLDTITTDSSYRDFDRVMAKRHRNKVIRLVLACFVFLIVIGVVVLLVVYFGKPHAQS